MDYDRNINGETRRTLSRDTLLSLRSTDLKLDQCTRRHIAFIGCAAPRRGCRGGRAKLKLKQRYNKTPAVSSGNRHVVGAETTTDINMRTTHLEFRTQPNATCVDHDVLGDGGIIAIPVIQGNRPNSQRPRQQRFRSSVLVSVNCSSNYSVPRTEWTPPTLYVFNAASVVKTHAIELLTAEFIGYDVDVAVVSETHLKAKHANSVVEVDGYTLFRRDRRRRKGGGVAIYVRRRWAVEEWPIPGISDEYELMWVKITQDHEVTFIGALYHPPKPIYESANILDHIETSVLRIGHEFPRARIILAGDFNLLRDNDIITRTGMVSIVTQPTRSGSKLDRIYVTDVHYSNIKIVKSSAKSDHQAIVAYSGNSKPTIGKTRRRCTYRRRTPEQHAQLLERLRNFAHPVNLDGDTQEEFNRFYDVMSDLLDTYYPERTVTITSSDPPYVTPVVKRMLRRKNRLMRAGQIERAENIADKIRRLIIHHNSTELTRVDQVSEPQNMWTKVRQLLGKSRQKDISDSSTVTADLLNDHYASISNDKAYKEPEVKLTTNKKSSTTYITEWRIFNILDKLPNTATGLDKIPSWFLRVGAPAFAAPIADLMNMSLTTSIVPTQWKTASILPVPKVVTPQGAADYRPISITSVLSRTLERIVVRDYIYPSIQCTHPDDEYMDFSNQFAFQPTGSTTVALIQLFHSITAMLETNPYVILYSIDFSKAFDTVRHYTLMEKFAALDLPDNIYNWIESFFRDHSHCTKFRGETSSFRDTCASIVQGSAIGPSSYVVVASDLSPLTAGNIMVKYADDTYLIVPANNVHTCASEVQHIEKWAHKNNLAMNKKKSSEMIIIKPRSNRQIQVSHTVIPGFSRVQSMAALGVTFSHKLSFKDHIDNLLAACAQRLFALRVLRTHGMSNAAIQLIYQAVIIAKLSYASPAWYGFTTSADRDRIEAFLRRSERLEFRKTGAQSFAEICSTSDDNLFKNIETHQHHLLHNIMPEAMDVQYSLRERSHKFKLSARTSALSDCNFVTRMLFKTKGYR